MDERTPFVRELRRAGHLLACTEESLEHVGAVLNSGGVAEAYAPAFLYAAQTERLLLHARTLPAYTGRASYNADLTAHLLEHVPIEIGFTAQGWFRVRIPALLPKKEKGSPDYIRDSLYAALEAYFSTHTRYKLREATLVFRHQYRFDRPDRQMRDHDNIELNAVTDALAMYVLVDDAPYLCDHYYCSIRAPTDGTEVFILPRNEFPRWLLWTAEKPKNPDVK